MAENCQTLRGVCHRSKVTCDSDSLNGQSKSVDIFIVWPRSRVQQRLWEELLVADNAKVLLDQALEGIEASRENPLAPDVAFELFTFEQALKENDLSGDELESGQTGGGNDGGIDGAFTFLNGNLVQSDSPILDPDAESKAVRKNSTIDFVLIQSKQSDSFGETAFEKASSTLRELLNLGKSEDDFRDLFSEELIQQFGIFRSLWQSPEVKHPEIRISFVYATKGATAGIDPKVRARGDLLIKQIQEDVPHSSVRYELLGARELIELHQREKSYTLELPYIESGTADNSYIALVRLGDYFEFLRDEAGQLRKYIFDWNVRDWAGDVSVNAEIRTSLEDPDGPEFWWLNNGVTVICSKATATGKTFSLDDVQIVNGLQTSVTIFNFLKDADEDHFALDRSVLVRLIVTEDLAVRDRVIRATNRQTSVPESSLRATDQIQRDIEHYLLKSNWFYDRRKNYYKNQGEAASRIISIPYLAQAIMAMGLSQPGNSRARPSSLINRDSDYEKIFDPTIDLDIFRWCAATQRRVDEFMRTEAAGLSRSEQTNLRFHVAMVLVASLRGSQVYAPSQLGKLTATTFEDSDIGAAISQVVTTAKSMMEETGQPLDKIAKGSDFAKRLISDHLPDE